MYELEFNSNDFVRNSFQIIKLHPVAVRCTSEMRRCYELLSPQDRQTFSFVDRTDGFLPIGGEYSSSPRVNFRRIGAISFSA
ncbi:hypothetical protein R69746_08677 [Paraburkholderia aspalathi]|nr:hypothetical protein R69746_08677 [Paraburkholderia aspalathi]